MECRVDQPCRVEIQHGMAVPGELKTKMFTSINMILAFVAFSNFNQSERLCFTHNTKITITTSYYDTLMAKFMCIYVNILVFNSP